MHESQTFATCQSYITGWTSTQNKIFTSTCVSPCRHSCYIHTSSYPGCLSSTPLRLYRCMRTTEMGGGSIVPDSWCKSNQHAIVGNTSNGAGHQAARLHFSKGSHLLLNHCGLQTEHGQTIQGARPNDPPLDLLTDPVCLHRAVYRNSEISAVTRCSSLGS